MAVLTTREIEVIIKEYGWKITHEVISNVVGSVIFTRGDESIIITKVLDLISLEPDSAVVTKHGAQLLYSRAVREFYNTQIRIDSFKEFLMTDEEFDALEEGKEFKTIVGGSMFSPIVTQVPVTPKKEKVNTAGMKWYQRLWNWIINE